MKIDSEICGALIKNQTQAVAFDAGQSGNAKATTQYSEEHTPPLIKARPMCVAHSLKGEGFDASEDGTGRGTPLIATCFEPRMVRTTGGATHV